MGMATFTDDMDQVRREFIKLKTTSDALVMKHPGAFKDTTNLTLSYGMSGDYKIAVEEGSNMVHIVFLNYSRLSLMQKQILKILHFLP